jgi:phage-related protein
MNEELKVIIRAELAQFKQAMGEAIQGLKKVANEGRKASKDIDGFTAEINQQNKALTDLKKKYIDLAAAHGKESKAAKDAAEQIRKLSAEYKNNRDLANNLANSANSFDVSLGGEKASQDIDKTNEAAGELQQTLETIRNLDMAQVMLEAFGPGVLRHLESAKEEFVEAGVFFGQIFQNFNKKNDSELFSKDNPNILDRFKGAGESVKLMLEDLGSGFKHLGQAFKKTFSGMTGVLAVVIANLIAIIGLTKNALNVAKQVKQMASEASKIGFNTDSYQEWGYVLKQTGIEADKLTDFIKTLTEEQNEVRDGSEDVIKAFEGIGLSAEEVMGSNQEELFRKTVMGLQNIENASERTSLAYKIFGEDAADLANILYLTNQETKSLIDNYYALGAAPSANLIQKSKELTGSTTNLSYAWQGLKNTLAEWVIPAVIAVVQWITTAIAYINVFLQGIFGISLGGKKASAGIGAIGSASNKATSGIKNTTKAVKELLRYTMGFDELNVIPKQSSSDSGSDAGAGAGAGGGYSNLGINPELPVIEAPDTSKFREWMEEYGSIIQGILTWSLLGIGVLMAVTGFMTGNIPMALLGISLAALGIGIGAAGGEDSHWSKLGQVIMDVLDAVKTFFVNTWNSIQVTFFAVLEVIKRFFADTWSNIQVTFSAVVEAIKRIWSAIVTWFEIKIAIIVAFFSSAWATTKQAFSSVGKFFKDTWAAVLDWFGIKVNGIVTFFSVAWKKIKDVFSTVKSFFSGVWDTITDVFSGIGTTVGNAVSGAFKSAINWVLEKAISLINGFIGSINAALTLINKIPGVNIKKLALLDVPKLATGGITTGATMAMIGERGKEAVLPLENNTGWMDVLAERIASKNSAPTRIALVLDGKELGHATIKSINNITKQTGSLQLALV